MSSPVQKSGALHRLSLTIIGSLEKFFYNWGYNIALHPWAFIISCLCFSAACGLGLLTFTPENRPDKLWIPWNSEFVQNSDWFRQKFPSPIRFHFAIITADDVLQPEILKQLLDIHEQVKNISVDGHQWDDICFKLPVTKFLSRRRRRRQVPLTTTTKVPKFIDSFEEDEDEGNSKPSDPSVDFSPDLYCTILENLDEACWESNLAELWEFNRALINNLTREDIIQIINQDNVSPIFGRPVNYTHELGGIERNATGHIIKAQAIMIRWYAKINQTALMNNQATNDLGTGEVVDKINLKWESDLAKVLLRKAQTLPPDMSMYIKVARSFGDISQGTIMGDAGMLAIGFMIVFVYVVFMLGKFNFVEQRPYLSLAGLSCVGLAILVSYGLCSAFRTIYGPVHNVLPFLLMGIGIDDMFVIMQCWNNLSPAEHTRSLPERMGLTLKHAGVSITVTSVTDFVAFAIGGTTVLPALQSFCIYAALGVIATYIFQATFFVAWFVLDQRRIEVKRNAFFFCIRHPDHKDDGWSQVSYVQEFFRSIYTKYLMTTPCKVLVLAVTGTLLGVNIYGNVKLRQEFNPIWFLPQDSYLFQYYSMRDKYFPGRGEDGMVIIHDVPLFDNMKHLESLVESLQSSKYIFEIDSWYGNFKNYTNTHFKKDVPNTALTQSEFDELLGRFLFSPSGAQYRQKFKVNGNLTCGESSPTVELSIIGFKFNSFSGPEEHLPAMREVKTIVKNSSFVKKKNDTKIFSWAFAYAGWETDEIITVELYRNMSLAMICVLLTTLLLIANFPTCLMVLTCVIFTLVDVGGMMHFWDLTIDTVSCIDLVLAIGLCVDYAAHIGHAFMTVIGSRNERASQALINIGPAVLNGGFSTFLAFVLLANSRSHVFITFFKIFFLVVVFGLYHGLVFLPVLLSIIGPEPYPSAFEKANRAECAVELNPSTSAIMANKTTPIENGELIIDRNARHNGEHSLRLNGSTLNGSDKTNGNCDDIILQRIPATNTATQRTQFSENCADEKDRSAIKPIANQVTRL